MPYLHVMVLRLITLGQPSPSIRLRKILDTALMIAKIIMYTLMPGSGIVIPHMDAYRHL